MSQTRFCNRQLIEAGLKSAGGNSMPRTHSTLLICIFTLAAAFGQQPGQAGRGGRGGGRGNMIPALEETGFRPIFDGQSMKGWDCDPDFWRVENGAIVGETRADHQPPQNIFCVWRDARPADFELKLQ